MVIILFYKKNTYLGAVCKTSCFDPSVTSVGHCYGVMSQTMVHSKYIFLQKQI